MTNSLKFLPFKSLPAKAEIEVIGNPTIGEIEVPKFGSLQLGEWLQYFERSGEIKGNKAFTEDQRKTAFRVLEATLILRRLVPEWTEKDTTGVWVAKDAPSGENHLQPSEALIEGLAAFFDKEFLKWRPTGHVFLVENQIIPVAERMAIAQAKKDGLVVVTRSDLESQGIFLGYRSGNVPQNKPGEKLMVWRVVKDFSAPEGFGGGVAEASQKK